MQTAGPNSGRRKDEMTESQKQCTKIGHDWGIFTTSDSDFRCLRCGQLGKNVRRYNQRSGKTEYSIRANTRR